MDSYNDVRSAIGIQSMHDPADVGPVHVLYVLSYFKFPCEIIQIFPTWSF